MRYFAILILFCCSCENPLSDDYRCNTLTSSKGEKIYVRSINWGVAGDYQISIITKKIDKLLERQDSIGTIEGNDPFIYHFKNDTLSLYFCNHIKYRILEKFKTIVVMYFVLDSDEYLTLYEKIDNKTYFTLPKSLN